MCVSTVFLGMDHAFGFGPPVLWETMVFGGKLDKAMWRYGTRRAARLGHDAVVAMVRATLKKRRSKGWRRHVRRAKAEAAK